MASKADEALRGVKNLRTDFRLTVDHDADRWWLVLLKLEHGGEGVSIDDLTDEISTGIVVPAAYTMQNRAARHRINFVSVLAQKCAIDRLNDPNCFPMVTDVILGNQLEDRHIDFKAEPNKPGKRHQVPADTVIMAVIDDGVAIAHELFADDQLSTRVERADIYAVEPDDNSRRASYGRSLDKADIDRLMKKCLRNGLLDDRAFYQATGQIDFFNPDFAPISQRRSHGTHVAAIAAGYCRHESVKNRPILCACLPPAVTSDVTGQTLLPSLALALHTIANAARLYRLEVSGKRAPVVLNFSYGNTAGPHDGTDQTAQLLEWHLALPGNRDTWLVLPAGNDNLSQTHAVLPIGNKKKHAEADAVALMLLPDDRTASHLELWMPFDAGHRDAVEVVVTTPCGKSNKPLPATDGKRQWLHDRTGRRVGQIGYKIDPPPTGRGCFSISLAPTYSLESAALLAPSGQWKIQARSRGKTAGDAAALDLRIHRDESVPGYRPGGRQSFFMDPKYQRFGKYGRRLAVDPTPDPSTIHRSGTISGFACGQSPVVVAAVTATTEQPSDYSASGPITQTPNIPKNPARVGPDVGAKADDSLILHGVISAGSSNGSFVRMTGTSVAAPRIARFAAEHIESAGTSARRFIYRYCHNPNPHDPRTGAGVIEVPIPWEH